VSNLQGTVYRQVRENLLSGHWESGQKLSELKLAADLGVNRNPVREALLKLASEGLLEREPGIGCRVPRWDFAEVADMYHLREALEGQAARLATQRVSNSLLDKLDEEVETMARCSPEPPIQTLVEIDNKFHQHLVQASGSRALMNAWETNHVRALFCREVQEKRQQTIIYKPPIDIEAHRRIVAAWRKRDPDEAEAVTREHIRCALSRILVNQTDNLISGNL